MVRPVILRDGDDARVRAFPETLPDAFDPDPQHVGIGQAQLIALRLRVPHAVHKSVVFRVGFAVDRGREHLIEAVAEPGVGDMPAVLFPDGMVIPVQTALDGEAGILTGLAIVMFTVFQDGDLFVIKLREGNLLTGRDLFTGGGEEPAAQELQQFIYAVDNAPFPAQNTERRAISLQGESVLAQRPC